MKKIKQFFETPKKAAISIACIAAALAVLGTGSVFAAAAIAENSSIGKENAQNFAFADAGIDPRSAAVVRTEFDFEDGMFVYEVEFIAENTEYEYQIKASDGKVVKKEMDRISPRETTINDENTNKNKITLEEAKRAALKDAGLTEEQVTFIKTKTDIEDGTEVYDLEFYAGNTEYEYEIHANTGAVYKKSQEPRDTQQGDSGQIDLESAKKTALTDAGLSASEVTFTKEKIDYEDGVPVYELEFYTAAQEYDYEINALTNTIRSKEAEAHNGAAEQNSNNMQNTNSDIGVEQAKAIAVKHAGLSASEVTFSKAKLDREDGVMVYEIEFYKNGMEYEYEIHAASGEIIKYDSEHED